MREEFEEYGPSQTTMYAAGAAKVGRASLMVQRQAVPAIRRAERVEMANTAQPATRIRIVPPSWLFSLVESHPLASEDQHTE